MKLEENKEINKKINEFLKIEKQYLDKKEIIDSIFNNVDDLEKYIIDNNLKLNPKIEEGNKEQSRINTLLESFKEISKQFLEKPKENISIGENISYRKTCFSIVSRGGVGKTTFILNQIRIWLSQNKKVLYINAEDDLYRVKEKIQYNKLKDIEKNNFFCIPNKTIFNLANYKVNIEKENFDVIEETLYDGIRLFKYNNEHNKKLVETEFLQDIKYIIKNNKIDVFIIDTFSLFYHIDTEIDNRIASELLGGLNSMASELNITIGFIHHTNKSNNSSINSGRGSSALYDGVRLSFTLSDAFESIVKLSDNPIDKEKKIDFIKETTNYDSIIFCDCSKNNYGIKKSFYFAFKDGEIEYIKSDQVLDWFNTLSDKKKHHSKKKENDIINDDDDFLIEM